MSQHSPYIKYAKINSKSKIIKLFYVKFCGNIFLLFYFRFEILFVGKGTIKFRTTKSTQILQHFLLRLTFQIKIQS